MAVKINEIVTTTSINTDDKVVVTQNGTETRRANAKDLVDKFTEGIKANVADLTKTVQDNKTEILNTIGNEEMGTTATTIKGAVKELGSHLNDMTIKQKYQGTNMYVDDSVSEASFDRLIKEYKKLNINSVLITYYINVGNDWSCTKTLNVEKANILINMLEQNKILFKGVKVHIKLDSSLNTTDIPDSFYSDYMTAIDSIMSLKINELTDTVIVFNESENFTNYYETNNIVKTKNFISSMKSKYKVTISMNYPQFQKIDKSILDMLDLYAFNIYPALSANGLNTTKERAMSLLENNITFNTIKSFNSCNKEVIISEIGCLDREVSLGCPELTGEKVEQYPFTGGKVKGFFYDCILDYLRGTQSINGVFLWDGITEFRPYESNVVEIFNKYWKESELI